jgi:nucleoside-diphosphate-sugar epimerase
VAADQLAQAYHLSFRVPVVILRPFNTYGPRQSARAVVPTMLTQVLAGREEIELGRLDTRRDLTYVSDTVEGFIRAATAADAVGETIQLGTGRSISIAELFEIVLEVTGARATIREDSRRIRPNASEVIHLLSSPERARVLLGWAPTISLEDGIRWTAAWISKHLGRYRPEALHV